MQIAIASYTGAGVVGKSVRIGYCVRETHYPRKICPTGETFLGKYVRTDRNSCPTLGKFVRPMSGCNFLHESWGGSESAQVVTRLIDLFVDIAVLLSPGKLVYRFSGTYSSFTPPDSCRVAGHVYHAVTAWNERAYSYVYACISAILSIAYN